MSSTKKLTMSAMIVAIGIILPILIRMIPNGGVLFSPMHIAPLLAGLAVGPVYGVVVGALCPILNSMISGMPQGLTLIAMCFELPTYGLVSGLLMMVLKDKNSKIQVYTSLVIAMFVGRIVGGIVQATLLGAQNYSLKIWATSYFVSTAPAIVIHIILIPIVYFALKKAKLV